MPINQAQFDTMYDTMRQYGHIMNRVPGNINESLAGRKNQRTYHVEHEEGYMVLERQGTPDNQEQTYLANIPVDQAEEEALPAEYDSGTDTDTVSSLGEEDLDFSEFTGLTEEQREQELFWLYQHAKRRWRRNQQKGTRKVRRYFRRRMKGKGRGKKRYTGKAISTYAATYTDDEYEEFFYGRGKGKGKGKKYGKRSSGKGGGRRTNPRGKDGQIMRCYGKKPNGKKCNSTDHLARDCPYNNGGGSKNSSSDTTQGANIHYATEVEA